MSTHTTITSAPLTYCVTNGVNHSALANPATARTVHSASNTRRGTVKMTIEKITITDLRYPLTDLDSIVFDRVGVEAVFRLLLEMGATKDIEMYWNSETGSIFIIKHFKYKSGMVPIEEDDGQRTGQQHYSLKKYIKTLVRFDRAYSKRVKNVQQKINHMHMVITKVEKQMKEAQ